MLTVACVSVDPLSTFCNRFLEAFFSVTTWNERAAAVRANPAIVPISSASQVISQTHKICDRIIF